MKKFLFALLFVLTVVTSSFAQENLFEDVRAERAKYPAGQISAENIAKVLNAVAWKHRAEGWGLLRKGAGNSCPLNGIYISCDVLVHAPSVTHWDALRNAEGDGTGTAEPQFNPDGPCVLSPSSGCEMRNFQAPFAPDGAPASPPNTPPPPPPPPPSVDFAPLLQRLDALDQEVAWLKGELAAQRAALTNTVESVNALHDFVTSRKIPASCVARANFGGFTIPLSCRLE